MGENLQAGSDSQIKTGEDGKFQTLQFDFASSNLGDIKQVQAGREELEKLLPPGLLEMFEPPDIVKPEDSKPNPGIEAFNDLTKELGREQLEAHRKKFPQFDKSVELVDKHLLEAARAYEGRPEFSRILELGSDVGKSMNAIGSYVGDAKNIVLHSDKVEVLQMVNKYLNSGTKPGDKPGILAKLEEMGHGSIVDHVKKLDAAQNELNPLYQEDAKERAKVHQAYTEASQVRTTYANALEQSLADYAQRREQGTLEPGEDAKFKGDDDTYGKLSSSEGYRRMRYRLYSRPVPVPKELKIEFKMPTPPRTHTA